MKQHATVIVNKPWVNRQPQAIILPASSSARRASSSQNDVTVVLPIISGRRFCDACDALVETDACFCGMCGNCL